MSFLLSLSFLIWIKSICNRSNTLSTSLFLACSALFSLGILLKQLKSAGLFSGCKVLVNGRALHFECLLFVIWMACRCCIKICKHYLVRLWLIMLDQVLYENLYHSEWPDTVFNWDYTNQPHVRMENKKGFWQKLRYSTCWSKVVTDWHMNACCPSWMHAYKHVFFWQLILENGKI